MTKPTPLASSLRNTLQRAVVEARDAAEVGARAALQALAVHHHEPYAHMSPEQRKLRVQLRARARQLGDNQNARGELAIDHLVTECAYEHWHRMLFARFLAENHLLIEPDMGVAISLEEAEELANEEGGKANVWAYVSRCAQRMLPQIFRPDDPLLQITFAIEHLLKLETLLSNLPVEVFTASDSLGWVYQFWQSKKKDEVNKSEKRIGADEISAVTQLFTEPYMVEFLLHNTLGAWWAGRKLSAKDAAAAKGEDELRAKLALPGVGWDYLRFVRGADGEGEGRASGEASAKPGWRPAAGTFDGWPKTAGELRVLDPCCGSGHFLVAALHHLVPIRMAEEGLSAADAVEAVLRDNLHGLEIDERCCQIAAFALAFAAWTYPDAGGYRPLPELNIACTGIGPQSTQEQWVKLAEQSGIPMPSVGREAIKNGLLNLHRLFSQAPTLGSLINPAELPADLIAADYETIQPYLTAIRAVEKADDETRERAVAAAGMVKAADLLAGGYTLVITNVPYLTRSKQVTSLQVHLEERFPEGKADLATALVLRSLAACIEGGTTALVTPQNWLFLKTYSKLRKLLLTRREWNLVARLGAKGFRTPMWDFNVQLGIITAGKPGPNQTIAGLDVSASNQPDDKANLLSGTGGPEIVLVSQPDQVRNPDAAISFRTDSLRTYLGEYAGCYQGLTTADDGKWRRQYWEVPQLGNAWLPLQTPSHGRGLSAGREDVVARTFIDTDDHTGVIRGREAWNNQGVAIDRVGGLARALYHGDLFHSLVPVVIPKSDKCFLPVVAFCLSDSFVETAKTANQALSIDNGYIGKLPFDFDHWQKVAAKDYPDGLPEPESDDPTQWLFHGWPGVNTPAAGAEPLQPLPPDEARRISLQVAVARLLGYRWPAETEGKAEGERRKAEGGEEKVGGGGEEGGMRLSQRARELVKRCESLLPFADEDGIVCIPALRGQDPAADRMLKLLHACNLEPHVDLDHWLRNDFFAEHCKLFHDRPFIWHIWDGRKRDGFHALVNYHKLCGEGGRGKAKGEGAEESDRLSPSALRLSQPGRLLLESLTYAYLGEWITRQRDGVKRGEGGAEDRLAAALELQKRLEAILEGEPPYDLFIRWKPLHQQPIGWEPDINDGVRLNIRPFLAADLPAPGGRKGAGILRSKPNIKWDKDRGKEPQRPKEEYPWFWGWDQKTEDFAGGKTFDGVRWNGLHYTAGMKAEARKRSAAEGKGQG